MMLENVSKALTNIGLASVGLAAMAAEQAGKAGKILAEKGVNHVEADVIRRNEQQRLLAASCGATFVRTACYYPGMNYD